MPALVLGLGGIWTELLDDVAIVPLPADAARIEHALRSMRGAPMLPGGARQRGVDLGSTSRGWLSGPASCCWRRRFEEIELNPVLVSNVGAVAVDAVVRRRAPATGSVRARVPAAADVFTR